MTPYNSQSGPKRANAMAQTVLDFKGSPFKKYLIHFSVLVDKFLLDSKIVLQHYFLFVRCNFSAVRSPIELKLGGDLALVSQISVHVLVSRFDYFLYCKQTKE
jgi:hypothetical protein